LPGFLRSSHLNEAKKDRTGPCIPLPELATPDIVGSGLSRKVVECFLNAPCRSEQALPTGTHLPHLIPPRIPVPPHRKNFHGTSSFSSALFFNEDGFGKLFSRRESSPELLRESSRYISCRGPIERPPASPPSFPPQFRVEVFFLLRSPPKVVGRVRRNFPCMGCFLRILPSGTWSARCDLSA